MTPIQHDSFSGGKLDEKIDTTVCLLNMELQPVSLALRQLTGLDPKVCSWDVSSGVSTGRLDNCSEAKINK